MKEESVALVPDYRVNVAGRIRSFRHEIEAGLGSGPFDGRDGLDELARKVFGFVGYISLADHSAPLNIKRDGGGNGRDGRNWRIRQPTAAGQCIAKIVRIDDGDIAEP